MILACKNIASSVSLQSGYSSTKALKLKLSEVKYRYRAIRAVLTFFKKQMNINMSKELVRVSKAIGLCLQTLRQAEEMRVVAAVKSAD